MEDLDLIESFKASHVRQDVGALYQDSMDNEPVKMVRDEIRQRLKASDPDEELEIDMEASDLQI